MKSSKHIITIIFIVFTSVSLYAQKNYAFEEDGKWGYCYQDTFFVIPQYEETTALGNNTCCFMAKKDGNGALLMR